MEALIQIIAAGALGAAVASLARELARALRHRRRIKVWRGIGHTFYRCPNCRIYAPWTHGIDEYQCQCCGTASPMPRRIMRAGERGAHS